MGGAEIPAIGETLANFRTRVGLSQQQLAKQLGKNRRSVAAWEGGDYLPKTKGDVLELARILVLNDEETTMLLKAAGIDPSLRIWNIPYLRNPLINVTQWMYWRFIREEERGQSHSFFLRR